MHKLIVELKQHTPIIHFQAHQKGATLRGSEIKPLINKYLEKKYHNKYQIKVSLYNSSVMLENLIGTTCYSLATKGLQMN